METATFIYNKEEITLNKNQKINRLTIDDLFKIDGRVYCKCICECGNIIESVRARSLLSGNTKSCGCLNKELQNERNQKHNDAHRDQKSRLYKIWVDMKRRCNNPKRKDAKNYLERGIKVCEEWDDFLNFKEWALNNGYCDDLTIERKDNNEDYCPQNCCWIPKSEQSKNRTTNHYITYNNKTQTLTEWAKELNINRSTLSNRLRNGWSIEKAFTT